MFFGSFIIHYNNKFYKSMEFHKNNFWVLKRWNSGMRSAAQAAYLRVSPLSSSCAVSTLASCLPSSSASPLGKRVLISYPFCRSWIYSIPPSLSLFTCHYGFKGIQNNSTWDFCSLREEGSFVTILKPEMKNIRRDYATINWKELFKELFAMGQCGCG